MPIASKPLPPPVFKKRDPSKPHELPEGWRWLRVGEKEREGDLRCDPRIEPVEIEYGGCVITKNTHPVMRKKRITPKEFLKLPMKERRRILRRQAAKMAKLMPDYGKGL